MKNRLGILLLCLTLSSSTFAVMEPDGPTEFNKVRYALKATIFGISCSTAILNVLYSTWAWNAAYLHNEVVDPHKGEANTIFQLTIAAAAMNGAAFLASLPLAWTALKSDSGIRNHFHPFLWYFNEFFLLGLLVVNTGIDIGAGVHIANLREAIAATPAAMLEKRIQPLWIALMSLTGAATVAAAVVPILECLL